MEKQKSNEAVITSKKNPFLDIRFEDLSYSLPKKGKGTHYQDIANGFKTIFLPSVLFNKS